MCFLFLFIFSQIFSSRFSIHTPLYRYNLLCFSFLFTRSKLDHIQLCQTTSICFFSLHQIISVFLLSFFVCDNRFIYIEIKFAIFFSNPEVFFYMSTIFYKFTCVFPTRIFATFYCLLCEKQYKFLKHKDTPSQEATNEK